MANKRNSRYTLYKSRMEGRPPKKARATRADIADRFKSLCLSAGLKVPEVAQALQVTERTVYAWFSGATAVPYSAYKLLRVLNRFELPGRGWEGWHMHSGKLWTPEGFGIEAHEGVWWSLMVRQARAFGVLHERFAAYRARVESAQRGAPLAGIRGALNAGATERSDGSPVVSANAPTFEDPPMVITGRTSTLSHTEKEPEHG